MYNIVILRHLDIVIKYQALHQVRIDLQVMYKFLFCASFTVENTPTDYSAGCCIPDNHRTISTELGCRFNTCRCIQPFGFPLTQPYNPR
jgi:hypothetical protein